jgi:hypothetical protein
LPGPKPVSSHPITTLFGQRRSWRRPHSPQAYPSRYYARSTDRLIRYETALLNMPAGGSAFFEQAQSAALPPLALVDGRFVRLARRELVWINVAAHPTAEWIAQQITPHPRWPALVAAERFRNAKTVLSENPAPHRCRPDPPRPCRRRDRQWATVPCALDGSARGTSGGPAIW